MCAQIVHDPQSLLQEVTKQLRQKKVCLFMLICLLSSYCPEHVTVLNETVNVVNSRPSNLKIICVLLSAMRGICQYDALLLSAYSYNPSTRHSGV
jgi:hypothetical protein